MIGSDFASILEAARLGAEWAWTAIYRDLSPVVMRYLTAHGAREPEDSLGEVFVQLVRNVSRFNGTERQFRAWVFMIARNRLVDEWRLARRQPCDLVPNDLLANAQPAGNSEEDALSELSWQQVIAMLKKLSLGQRDVLFLRVIGGFSIQETAQVLRRRPGAVKALQSRALARIRREISRKTVSF